MTDMELLAAIQADATAASLAAAGNDAGCAARLTAILPGVPDRYIPTTRLIYWGALTGVRTKLEYARSKSGPFAAIPDGAWGIVLTYFDMLAGGGPGLDTQDPAIVGTGGLLDALVAVGVFTADGAGSKADLLTQVPTTPVNVTGTDVGRVLLPSREGA